MWSQQLVSDFSSRMKFYVDNTENVYIGFEHCCQILTNF